MLFYVLTPPWLANHKGKVFGDKLIGDIIPQIIEDSGKKAIIEKVSGKRVPGLIKRKAR